MFCITRGISDGEHLSSCVWLPSYNRILLCCSFFYVGWGKSSYCGSFLIFLLIYCLSFCLLCCCSFLALFLSFLCLVFLLLLFFSSSIFFYNLSSCCLIDREIAAPLSNTSSEGKLLMYASSGSCIGSFLDLLNKGILSSP